MTQLIYYLKDKWAWAVAEKKGQFIELIHYETLKSRLKKVCSTEKENINGAFL